MLQIIGMICTSKFKLNKHLKTSTSNQRFSQGFLSSAKICLQLFQDSQNLLLSACYTGAVLASQLALNILTSTSHANNNI